MIHTAHLNIKKTRRAPYTWVYAVSRVLQNSLKSKHNFIVVSYYKNVSFSFTNLKIPNAYYTTQTKEVALFNVSRSPFLIKMFIYYRHIRDSFSIPNTTSANSFPLFHTLLLHTLLSSLSNFSMGLGIPGLWVLPFLSDMHYWIG